MDEKLRQLIIQELSLQEKTSGEVDEIVTTLGGLILKMVFLNISNDLDDDAVIEFEKVLEENNQEKLAEFFSKNVDDIDAIVAKSSREIIDDYKQFRNT